VNAPSTPTATANANATPTRRAGKARVMLVDDHPIVRQGLANLIDAEDDLMVCAQVEDAASAMQSLGDARPDIVLVDISLKDRSSGLELVKEIRGRFANMPMLVLSMHDELLYAERALRAGAKGYVMKQEATEKVMDAIRRVLSGELYVSEKMAARLMNQAVNAKAPAEENPLARLSDRELEVFTMIGHGLGTRDIANKLLLSVKTVEAHREHIKEKLNLKSGTELMRVAVQYTLQDAPGTKP
jgi:DNA-binding NarL/FixJ family response regulator